MVTTTLLIEMVMMMMMIMVIMIMMAIMIMLMIDLYRLSHIQYSIGNKRQIKLDQLDPLGLRLPVYCQW